jgi:hypothetical protein
VGIDVVGFDLGVRAVPQQVLHQLDRTDLRGQPLCQLLLVRDRRRPELQRLADLLAVVLGSPANQRVLREVGGRDLHQVGDILHRGRRDLFQQVREPALQLEELQQQAEAEPGRPALVRHEVPVTVHQRPTGQQLL